ncbi:hypothetical protein [Roseivirga misakiensis]|uniref:Uncharacterized protein n=1 Tax=Roseivirga misakiensis TaxID=1563681 RepID=A0A1E5SYG6_9BACT|nr:hypothetical protein [Roseivirga misakiensis]OEK04152.1 hypothetical protein BFP71_11745 [Roseivirga misakiensis]
MIIIKHPKDLSQASEWKERLEKMTVPHLVLESSKPVAELVENNRNGVIGIEAINTFLNQYEKDLKGWNQDRCDKWFFDESD